MAKKTLKNICKTFAQINPNPQIELNHVNAFTLLVAVVLSAQCTDKMVNRCTEELFKTCNTPFEMLALGEEGLKIYISRILFANNKARHIIGLSKMLIEQHNGEVPSTFEQLVRLPGVGRKSADVVLNSWFGKPTIAVDRHILRVCNTMGILKAKTTNEVADKLMKITPKEYKKQIHHWLVLHGRYTCTARKKHCNRCPIAEFCKFFNRP